MIKLIAVIWISGAFYGYYEHPTYFDTVEACKSFAIAEYEAEGDYTITELDNGNLGVEDSSGKYYAEVGCNKKRTNV